MSTPDRFAFFRRYATRLALSVLIALLFWVILRGGGLPVVPDLQAFSAMRWWTCGAYALCLVAWSLVRAIRTRHLLRPVAPVSTRQILAVSWIGFLAIFVLPFRLGEVVRPALFHTKSKVPFATATGSLGAERIIDGLYLMVVLGVALPLGRPLHPLPDHIGRLPIPVVAVPAAAYSMLLVFIGAFVAMALFYWRRGFARRITQAVLGLFSKRLGCFVSDQVEKLSEGFRFLPSAKHFIPYLAETTVYWAVAALGMWLLAWGCGIPGVTFAQACAFMGVLGLGIIVPGAPGYFGAFQGSVYAGLALYFPESVVLGAGSAYVFLLYVLQLSMMVVNALVALIMERGMAEAAANAGVPAADS
jgi:glycosyltransferase 2 family protein